MRLPSCPVCQRNLQSLGSENLVAPFWTKPGRFFLYPMHLNALAFISALTLTGVVVSIIFGKSLLGFLLSQVVWLVLLKYSFAVIEDTALGHIQPLPVNEVIINQEMDLPFKLYAILLAISYGTYWVGDNLGIVPYILALIIANLALPANIMVLAMEHSLFAALNPVIVFPVILRIGLPYLFLFLLLFLLTIAESTTLNILVDIFPYNFAYAVVLFTTMFFTVVMAHLLGYTLYQYHDTLGITIEKEADEPGTAAINSSSQSDPELRSIEILIQEGRHQEAITELTRFIASNHASNQAHTMLFRLLHLSGDNTRLLAEGRKYISYLFAQNDTAQALSVFNRIYQLNPRFRPASANERYEIANQLYRSGQYKPVIALLNNLHIDFPEYSRIPEAYLLVAKILCDKLNNDTKARQVLDFLRSRFPESPLQQEISQYYAVVEQLNNG